MDLLVYPKNLSLLHKELESMKARVSPFKKSAGEVLSQFLELSCIGEGVCLSPDSPVLSSFA